MIIPHTIPCAPPTHQEEVLYSGLGDGGGGQIRADLYANVEEMCTGSVTAPVQIPKIFEIPSALIAGDE